MNQPAQSRLFEKVRKLLKFVGPALQRVRTAVIRLIFVLGRILDFGGRWILRILIVGLVLLPTIAVLSLLVSGVWTPDIHVGAMAFWVALSLAVAGGAWTILWMLLRIFLRFVRSSSLGKSIYPRLIALLVVFAFFPKIITPTIGGIAWGTVTLAIATPINLMRLSENALEDSSHDTSSAQAEPASVAPKKFDDSFALVVLTGFSRELDKAISLFAVEITQRLPLKELAVAISVWFLLGLLLHEASVQGSSSRALAAMHFGFARLGELRRFIGTSASQYPSLNWPNVGFLLILTTGMFLSMAAITSLPRLREHPKPNSEVNAESLKRDLSELQLSQSDIESYYGGEMPSQIVTFEADPSVHEVSQIEERAKPVVPVAPDLSKSREGRATDSEADFKKEEPRAIDVSRASKTSPKEQVVSSKEGDDGSR